VQTGRTDLSEPAAEVDADLADATRGGVNEPALPVQRGRESPLSIDLIGEICPFTFVRTRLALEALPIGGVLRVVVDHEPAIRNIPRSAAEWGQEVLGVTGLGPGTWAIDLRRRVR
jgi:TusA-related sulfurtransferase